MVDDSDLFRLQNLRYNARLVSWRIVMQESEVLQTCLWAGAFVEVFKFSKYNVSVILPCDSFIFRYRNLHDRTLVIAYKTFFTVRILLAMLGRLTFLVAQIRLEHFLLGSKKYTHVSSPVTNLSKAFLLYFGYFFNKDLAFLTRDLLWSSVSKWGLHLT